MIDTPCPTTAVRRLESASDQEDDAEQADGSAIEAFEAGGVGAERDTRAQERERHRCGGEDGDECPVDVAECGVDDGAGNGEHCCDGQR